VKIGSSIDVSDYYSVKVPDDSDTYSVSIFTTRNPDAPEFYHQHTNGHTIWNNKKDTIRGLWLGAVSGNTKKNQKIEVKVKVDGLKKLDDLYSLSYRANLEEKISRSLGGKSIELDVDSYSSVGRFFYLVDKRDDDYRELAVHPVSNKLFRPEILVKYGDLPIHRNRETLALSTNHRAFVQINANSKEGDTYNIYTSPRTLETFDELEVDIPVGIDIEDYNVSVILRDFDSAPGKILVKSIGQKLADLRDFKFRDQVEDISYLVTTNEGNYSVNLDGNKFDEWMLNFGVQGLIKTNTVIPSEYFRISSWIISGKVESNAFDVFLPELPNEVETEIFGERGYVQKEQGSWSFIRQKSNTYKESSSFQALK
jgi:hypothetical protein